VRVTCHYRGSKIPRQVTMVGTLRRMCSVLQPAGTSRCSRYLPRPHHYIFIIYRANVPLCAEEGWVQQNARVHAHTHTPTHKHKQTHPDRAARTPDGDTDCTLVIPPGGAVRWKKTPSRTGTHNNIVRSRIKNNSNNNIIMDVPISPPRHRPSLPPRPLSVRFLSRCGARSPTHTHILYTYIIHCYYYLRTIDARASSVFASLAFGPRYARCSLCARLQS